MVLVGLTLVVSLPNFSVSSTPSSVTSTNFEAIDFQVTLASVGFSNASYDHQYIQMLKDSGASTIVIESDPIEFMAYQSRMVDIMNYSHSLGLKVHLINQMDTRNSIALINLKNPLETIILPPKFSTVLWDENHWIAYYASFHPDILTVIAEPSNLNVKMRVGFTDSQWSQIISTLINTSNTISPKTQTWVDLVPSKSIVDYNLGSTLVTMKNLTGIGWDVYNYTEFSVIAPLLKTEVNYKSVGMTETWFAPMWSKPQFDNVAFVKNATNWFSLSYSTFEKLTSQAPALYDPFFTSQFVSTIPLSGSGFVFFDNIDQALVNQNRTQIFYGYQNLTSDSS